MHPLLEQQLGQLGLSPEATPDAKASSRLIARIDAAYAQAALPESEGWIRLINDNLPVMIAYIDANEVSATRIVRLAPGLVCPLSASSVTACVRS